MRKEISTFIDVPPNGKPPTWTDLAQKLRQEAGPRLVFVSPYVIHPIPIYEMEEKCGVMAPVYTRPLGKRHYLLGAIEIEDSNDE